MNSLERNKSNKKSVIFLGVWTAVFVPALALGMDYNQGTQEARKWILLANQISEGEDTNSSVQQTVREELSEENKKLLDSYCPEAASQALANLAVDPDFRALKAARKPGARSGHGQAGEEASTRALERAVDLKLLSLLAHKQKAATQEKDKEHTAAFCCAYKGWGVSCLGVAAAVVAVFTYMFRVPECPRAY